jgi:hypothetical protein
LHSKGILQDDDRTARSRDQHCEIIDTGNESWRFKSRDYAIMRDPVLWCHGRQIGCALSQAITSEAFSSGRKIG